MLRTIVPTILSVNSSVVMLLIGVNGDAFRQALISKNPALADRILATGALQADELSLAISACEILLQPYPDGVTTRRTSMMAALEHARAIVTTRGPFTEPLWERSGAVAMVEAGDSSAFASVVGELLEDRRGRCHYASAAKALYANCFDVSHTIKALRGAACA
jgi:glycosyltransferase involved in cell wall biosynthesis